MTRSWPEYPAILGDLNWSGLPGEVKLQAKRCLKDILATAAGARLLPTSSLAEEYVHAGYGPGEVPLWFASGSSTALGAAWYNAFATDSLDCHDGFRPNKGHAGATVVPLSVGACVGRSVHGSELLCAIVLGYEIACRAGRVVHSVYDPYYHASGSWAALGAAAAASRILKVPSSNFDFVLGCAEYYAPMSPMMRCVASPSTVKDSAAAGAWAAATAVAMHGAGLRGLPSLFEAEDAGREEIATLGREWLIRLQYFKPYPVCRWAQPAVEGTLALQRKHRLTHHEISSIVVETFEEGAALTAFPPQDTDAAQYSMPWAVAAAAVDGALGVPQVHPSRLGDPEILDLGGRMEAVVAEDLDARFPEECLARVTVRTEDGRVLRGETLAARGDHAEPLSEEELNAKYEELTIPSLGREKSRKLADVLDTLDLRQADELVALL